MFKNNKTKILTIVLLGLLLATSSVLAARIEWPRTPAGHEFPQQGIPELVRYFYEWGIALGGLIVFIALLIAGFQYLTSTGNPAVMQNAREKIKSAFFGLLLLLGSWLILNTINPQFTQFPELQLNLSDIPTSNVSVFSEKSPYVCQGAFIFHDENYTGSVGYIAPDKTYNQSWGSFEFENDAEFGEIGSVQVWRQINCSGCDDCNETYNIDDELILPLNQAIATCQSEKLAENLSENQDLSLIPQKLKELCNNDEIEKRVKQFLIDKYKFVKESGGEFYNDYHYIPPPFQNQDTRCEYKITDQTFNIDYDIPLPKYYVSDGNCTLQISKASWDRGCGDRIAEIYGTYPKISSFTDADIECIKLVSSPTEE
jgi:hypothetical protein